ncbi:DUF6370 family protein [Flavobacterium amniphilum]|uniref:DUF6370 family protein n=1 Tax=Flavobacterium amniphilum TaxID=1834035 RepID=UPI002029BB19|nr:DUF6370 family protein [Flavobacterium amniphilum]MCL9804775.1 DUF6370 family protein [Flavobacterium amniphilum]
MKRVILTALLAYGVNAGAQEKSIQVKDQLVEASCGECQFEMDGKSCDLAVKFEGKAYFVEGIKIDDYGDAHAHNGLCNAVRKAKVSGEIKNEKFIASSFVLVEDKKK